MRGVREGRGWWPPRDGGALADAYAEFLAHLDPELAEGRPEYDKHRASIQEFRQAAAGGRAGS